MVLFKKPESFAPYTDAPLYAAHGWQPVPAEKYYAEQGPYWATPDAWESPRGGAFAWGLPTPQAGDIANWVVSIMGGILPREGNRSLTEAKATWAVPIRVDNPGKRAARDIEALAPGALIRTDVESNDLLLVFRTAPDVYDNRAFGFRERGVRCLGNDVFLAAGPRFIWRDGRSPATVGRADLPVLNWNGARDLVATIDAMLSKAAA